jgi:ABC-2 type transport system ATP-binding protein
MPLAGKFDVYQNLRIFGMLYGVRNLKERIDILLKQFEIEQFRM